MNLYNGKTKLFILGVLTFLITIALYSLTRLGNVSANPPAPETLVSGLNNPSGIGVDDTHVYWGQSAWSGKNGRFSRVPKTGGTPTILVSDHGWYGGFERAGFFVLGRIKQ